MNAGELEVGTVLTSFDGDNGIVELGMVTAVERVEQPQTMYNLTVDEAHTFFVGEGQWLVHNTSNCLTVTDELIREAMRDATLMSQQPGGISLPKVQKLVDDVLSGNVRWDDLLGIEVENGYIVDGNHRYVASKILGLEAKVEPWIGARPSRAVSWNDIPIDWEDWGP